MDSAFVQQAAVYLIPALLLLLGCLTKKLIEGGPWSTRHFFVGIDLTIYFLATTLVDILDLARNRNPPPSGIFWSVCLIVGAVLFLLFQTSLHQDWEPLAKAGWIQTFMLCGVSNGSGLVLLYTFMSMKVSGANDRDQ